MKFRVTIKRDINQEAIIKEIEADSVDDAIDKAIDHAVKGDVDWTTIEHPPIVTDIEIVT